MRRLNALSYYGNTASTNIFIRVVQPASGVAACSSAAAALSSPSISAASSSSSSSSQLAGSSLSDSREEAPSFSVSLSITAMRFFSDLDLMLKVGRVMFY